MNYGKLRAASELHVGRPDFGADPGSTHRHYRLFDNSNSHVICPCCGSDRLRLIAAQPEYAGRESELLHVAVYCKCSKCSADVMIGFNQNGHPDSIDAGVSGSQG